MYNPHFSNLPRVASPVTQTVNQFRRDGQGLYGQQVPNSAPIGQVQRSTQYAQTRGFRQPQPQSIQPRQAQPAFNLPYPIQAPQPQPQPQSLFTAPLQATPFQVPMMQPAQPVQGTPNPATGMVTQQPVQQPDQTMQLAMQTPAQQFLPPPDQTMQLSMQTPAMQMPQPMQQPSDLPAGATMNPDGTISMGVSSPAQMGSMGGGIMSLGGMGGMSNAFQVF